MSNQVAREEEGIVKFLKAESISAADAFHGNSISLTAQRL